MMKPDLETYDAASWDGKRQIEQELVLLGLSPADRELVWPGMFKATTTISYYLGPSASRQRRLACARWLRCVAAFDRAEAGRIAHDSDDRLAAVLAESGIIDVTEQALVAIAARATWSILAQDVAKVMHGIPVNDETIRRADLLMHGICLANMRVMEQAEGLIAEFGEEGMSRMVELSRQHDGEGRPRGD